MNLPDLIFLAGDEHGDVLRIEAAQNADADENPGAVLYAHTTQLGCYLKPGDVDELISALREFGTGQPDPTTLDHRRVAAAQKAVELLATRRAPFAGPTDKADDVLQLARFLLDEEPAPLKWVAGAGL